MATRTSKYQGHGVTIILFFFFFLGSLPEETSKRQKLEFPGLEMVLNHQKSTPRSNTKRSELEEAVVTQCFPDP